MLPYFIFAFVPYIVFSFLMIRRIAFTVKLRHSHHFIGYPSMFSHYITVDNRVYFGYIFIMKILRTTGKSAEQDALEALVTLSREVGQADGLVLAGGGNTSAKTDKFLFVKASGTSLAQATPESFVKISRARLQSIFDTPYTGPAAKREDWVLQQLMAAREPGEEKKRPSVETLLHGLLPHAFVVHTHPALVNGITCSQQGPKAMQKLFGDAIVWIPYTDPGYPLALLVKTILDARGRLDACKPLAIFLQNHGLIVAGPTPKTIWKYTGELLKKIATKAKKSPDFSPANVDRERAAAIAPALRMLLGDNGRHPSICFDASCEIVRFVQSKKSFRAVSSAFTPDHIVYCQAAALFVPAKSDLAAQYEALKESIEKYREIHKTAPAVVAVQNLGVFACGTNRSAAATVLALFRDTVAIAIHARAFGGASFMKPSQIAFIRGWEVERYRKSVSLPSQTNAACTGKIAIVTGAAQGFGKGLAEALLQAGAEVVLADMNLDLARQAATEFCARFGKDKALALAVNVGDETSVRDLVRETVLACGGLDIFVSNAGILKAGSLDVLSPTDFDKVTRVNYTGFYYCVKNAANVMKIQHRFAPQHFADIIQLNSKSGLTGSKNNFAYAGGKFGGIGLAQSFALELVDDRIKVNAICPGNLFDGPLWSDPVNGLFVQYLRTGKVPGARTIADVRRSYESKVPMGRGCTVADVAKALLYCIGQEYETGQAIPVTGGQVMLS